MTKLRQQMMVEAIESLTGQVGALQTELYMRAAPRLAEINTALSRATLAANNDKDPKTARAAKQMLQEFFAVWEAARIAGSGIVIPTQRPEKFESPENHPEGWSSNPG